MPAKTTAEIIDARKSPEHAKRALLQAIRDGGVFAYPTDTIYGLGCDARDAKAVKKIRELKKRDSRKPFSVIAPSKAWISENCFLNSDAKKALSKLLPGAFTLVLKLKKKNCVSREANAGARTLGVRIPRHWIAGVVEKAGIPVVTTSVNEAGAPPAQSLAEIEKLVKKGGVDLIVFEGALGGKPSRVIDFTKPNWKIKRE
jgi:tRNA threonylcarbamoyl adenosine modification protein (Sua5/YciO/YrdC/YwlC family)